MCSLIKYERKGRQSKQAKHSELIFPNTYKQEFWQSTDTLAASLIQFSSV